MAPYQSAGFNGGHSFNRLGTDTFEVTYQSNTTWEPGQLHDYCLLRAAEVTKDFGFDYFTVEGEIYDELTRVMPTTHTTTVTTTTPASGSSSGSTSSSSSKPKPVKSTTTVSTPGFTQFNLPSLTLRIRCFTTFPTTPHLGMIYEAGKLREELAARYAIVLY